MTDDELGRVFTAFSQGDHSERGGSHPFGGLGLGLTISPMLVKLHSSTFTGASEGRNCGTNFSITLPLTQAGDSINFLPSSAPPGIPVTPSTHSSAKYRIPLVEDHDATRNALAFLLIRRGHQLTTAGTIEKALTSADADQFDLVISDINLPDGDRCDLMLRLRDRYGLKEIAVTGYGMDYDIARTQASGFVCHLTKPTSIENLNSAIALIEENPDQ